MTKEEAINFLRFKKVYVKGFTEQIQRKAFTLGWKWRIGGQTINRIDDPFLLFSEDEQGEKVIDSCKSVLDFYSNECDEISAEEIINIIIDGAKYRTFKDHEECWQEMLKHEPFGWIKSKFAGCDYTSFKRISEDNDYEKVFNSYTFADGTPFGIKED